ncbi:MAG: hypothetical protein IJR00_02020 [Lachnospiraceae bacterium]|nr:hypothetical protein [Lachnospiraceae bacterium]
MSISRKMSTKEKRSESGEKDSSVKYPVSSGLVVIGKNSSCRRPNPAFSRYSPPEEESPRGIQPRAKYPMRLIKRPATVSTTDMISALPAGFFHCNIATLFHLRFIHRMRPVVK